MKRFYAAALLLLCLVLLAFPVLAVQEKHTPPPAEEINTIYAIDQQYQTYHVIPAGDWERVRAALTLPVTPTAENTTAKDMGGFCFVLKNGTRALYTITDSQVLVGDTPLMASIFQRNTLESLSKALCAANPANPAMLAYMNPDKASVLTVKGYGATGGRIDPQKPLDFTVSAATDRSLVQNLVRSLRDLRVQPSATEFVSETPRPDTNDRTLYLGLEFNTGTRYDMTLGEDFLLIRSSDGVRTYRYPLAYTRQSGGNPIWGVREHLWDAYAGSASCVEAGVFLKRTDTKERMAGTFYSTMDGGDAPLARLSRVVDRILAAPSKPTVLPAGSSIVELYVQMADTGKNIRFELDESLTAYYLNDAGRGVSAAITREDWDTVRALLNSESNSEKLMLLEKDGSSEFQLLRLKGTEPFLSALFQTLPKDPDFPAYNTGPKPDYAVNGIHCWVGKNGKLTETTIYPTALVQESNLLPWTPAEYDVTELYQLFNRNF